MGEVEPFWANGESFRIVKFGKGDDMEYVLLLFEQLSQYGEQGQCSGWPCKMKCPDCPDSNSLEHAISIFENSFLPYGAKTL